MAELYDLVELGTVKLSVPCWKYRAGISGYRGTSWCVVMAERTDYLGMGQLWAWQKKEDFDIYEERFVARRIADGSAAFIEPISYEYEQDGWFDPRGTELSELAMECITKDFGRSCLKSIEGLRMELWQSNQADDFVVAVWFALMGRHVMEHGTIERSMDTLTRLYCPHINCELTRFDWREDANLHLTLDSLVDDLGLAIKGSLLSEHVSTEVVGKIDDYLIWRFG